MILEVRLGGRLDANNIVDSHLEMITASILIIPIFLGIPERLLLLKSRNFREKCPVVMANLMFRKQC